MDEAPDRIVEVAAFLAGEPSQISSVERAVRGTVRSFHLKDRELERDLVQEALTRTVASLSARRFLGDSSLNTYARNVARYTVLEWIRRRRHEVALDPELQPAEGRWPAPEETLLSTEQHRLNLAAYAALPADCREILGMICVDGSSYREVAGHLGISEAALKSRIHRCRLTCRQAATRSTTPRRLVLDKASS